MNNWFALTTDGSNTWVSLSGLTEASPASGTLRVVGQTPTISTSMGVIDGGGDIVSRVEVTQQLFWDLLGSLTETQQLIWQVIQTLNPTVGTVRIVGQQPTAARTLNQFASPASFTFRLVGQAPTATATGDESASPGSGTFRLVGNVPALEPNVVAPLVGSLRVIGQLSGLVDLGHKVSSPTPGTIRFVGQGRIEKAQALTWTIFDSYVTASWEILWQRSAFVYFYQSQDWDIYSKVCGTRHRLRQRRMTTAPRTRSMTLRATQRRIQVRSCANQ